MAKVISLCTAKGGTSKSSSTVELASVLHEKGKRVLVFDLDENCTLTKNIGETLDREKNIYEIFIGNQNLFDCIKHNELFDIIHASKSLSKANTEFTDRDDVFLLSDLCEALKDDYDYIFVDNAPSRSILLTMTYVACDYVIIPTLCDEGSLDLLNETEMDIRKLTDGRLKESHAQIIGYILAKYKSSNINDIAYDRLIERSENNPEKPFVLKVSDTVKISEVKTFRTAITRLEKNSKVSNEYIEIANKILERID